MTNYNRFLTARMYFQARRYREAIVELKAVLAREERTSLRGEALELLALANFKAAYLPEAERIARELIATNPTDAYAHTILVRSLERQSKRDEANSCRRLAVAVGADV